MCMSRGYLYSYLLAIFLAYTTIANFSVYFLGSIINSIIILILCLYGLKLGFALDVKENKKEVSLFIVGWGLVLFVSTVINGCLPSLQVFSHLILCSFILCMNTEFQKLVFKNMIWVLTILLILSATEYLIYIITDKCIVIANVTRITSVREGDFRHFLFNLVSVNDIMYRFKGLCPEAGNMGTLCAFMLFATWKIKSMKIPFFVFLVCGLISLSLAYYVFLFVFLITNVKPNPKNIIIGFVVFSAFLLVFKDFFEDRLVERLMSVDSIEQLDNRTTETFDRYFKKAFDEGDLWLGVGAHNIPHEVTDQSLYGGREGGNAGVKKWIYEYGIIGFVFIFYIYNIIYYRKCKKKLLYHDWIYLLVFWACIYKSIIFTYPCLFIVYSMMPVINRINVKKILYK